jgi:hypothetical protein
MLGNLKKLLLIGHFGPAAIENQFYNNIKKFSVDITKYDLGYKYTLSDKVENRFFKSSKSFDQINQNLLQYVKVEKPQIILVIKGYELYPDTILELKKSVHIVANYNPDHPLEIFSRGGTNKNILNSVAHYDIHFSYASKIVKKIEALFQIPSFWIPFGYDSDQVINRSKSFEKFAFIGAYDSVRNDQIQFLNINNLLLFGDNKWASRNPLNSYIKKVYQNKSLYGDDYANMCCNSLGVFNFLRLQNINESSHNMRTFEVAGYGGVLISNRTDEHLNFFDDEKEAIFFENMEELKEKIKFLEKNPKTIESIKEMALKRSVKSCYSYHSRMRELLSHFNNFLK